MGVRSLVDLALGGRVFRMSGGSESLICGLVSNAIDKGQLSIVRKEAGNMPRYDGSQWRASFRFVDSR
ncbi:hypothetical protein ACVMFA_003736 [Bradyrhizobium liaoningense]